MQDKPYSINYASTEKIMVVITTFDIMSMFLETSAILFRFY